MKKYINMIQCSPHVLGIILAFFGGTTTAMKNVQFQEFNNPSIWNKIYYVVIFSMISGFVGVVAAMVMSWTDFNPQLEGAIIALSGACSKTLLDKFPDLIYDWARHVVGLDKETKD